MHPAQLIKLTKHPVIVWFDRIAPVICLALALYYGVQGSYTSAAIWGATAVLALVLSVCNLTKIMQKVLTKVVARRGF
ncbi:hypothetical protein DV532_25285 (plasmid) [Pseudomonas sp. Leaf58]|uniref:hypothetical protein n=1 Tax=unclassified Pseudomonas TaxID=196821 RepID=UPI0006F37B44|nr:hypothetical protein [Pseudomonas sp. Leaf58]AYG47615.1 hypothetical protein DV532_25285 [Pseudomonas sp. Leaf58]KQN62822.1 hypothetical protein ASF02_11810 [Pseudomonas sp. Leaf58]